MTIQRTLWSPDTCGCQIEYEWDDAVPQDQRTHTVSKVNKTCAFHSHLPDKESIYADIMDENQSKNRAIGLLVKALPKLDGGDAEIKWRFDENRNVILSHTSLTQTDKDTMNALPKTGIKKQMVVE